MAVLEQKASFSSLLDLEGKEFSKTVDYFLEDKGFIIVLNRMFPFGEELIEFSKQRPDLFFQATVVNGNNAYQDTNFRSSQNMFIHSSRDPSLERFQNCIASFVANASQLYRQINKDCVLSHDTGYELLKYEAGQFFGPHVDIIYNSDKFNRRRLSMLIYLNNNYTGGELNFPRHGMMLKPDVGDILMFPSEFMYPHESLPILSGTKYAVVTWLV